jgi:hypothetical protein
MKAWRRWAEPGSFSFYLKSGQLIACSRRTFTNSSRVAYGFLAIVYRRDTGVLALPRSLKFDLPLRSGDFDGFAVARLVYTFGAPLFPRRAFVITILSIGYRISPMDVFSPRLLDELKRAVSMFSLFVSVSAIEKLQLQSSSCDCVAIANGISKSASRSRDRARHGTYGVLWDAGA